MDGYVMPKHGYKNLLKDDSWIDIIMDDVYDTFYKDKEEEKFLAMVESEKARVKDYRKLVVTDEMIDYVLEKYGNKWKSKDEIAYFILEDLWLNYGKYDKGKEKLVEDNGKGKMHEIQNRVGSVEVDLASAIKAKQVDDYDDDDLDSLDLANRIKKLEEDFGRLLKAKKAKESKKAKKAKEAKKAREAELAKHAQKVRGLN
nr:hypothetical protein [Tanacetum cinerariifolium]